MAQGELTIGIPGAGASDFASSPITSLTITQTPQKGPPTRGKPPAVSVRSESINGTSAIGGRASAAKFIWTINCILSFDDARKLTTLADWQSDQYQNSNDGVLRLIDETKYINNFERQVWGRSLLAQIDESWNSAYKYGYGVFGVLLQLPEDFEAYFGNITTGESSLTFTIVEVGA